MPRTVIAALPLLLLAGAAPAQVFQPVPDRPGRQAPEEEYSVTREIGRLLGLVPRAPGDEDPAESPLEPTLRERLRILVYGPPPMEPVTEETVDTRLRLRVEAMQARLPDWFDYITPRTGVERLGRTITFRHESQFPEENINREKFAAQTGEDVREWVCGDEELVAFGAFGATYRFVYTDKDGAGLATFDVDPAADCGAGGG